MDDAEKVRWVSSMRDETPIDDKHPNDRFTCNVKNSPDSGILREKPLNILYSL